MNRLLIPGLLALTLVACSGSRAGRQDKVAENSSLQADPFEQIAAGMAADRDKFPGPKIVVYEFQDIAGAPKTEGRLVAERLTTCLARTGGFEVIERSRLDTVLAELRLSASGLLDEKTAIRAGEILGADAVVSGTLARVGDRYEINARAISVSGGRIVSAARMQVSESSLNLGQALSAAPPARSASPRPARSSPAGPIRDERLPDWEIWPGLNDSYGRYSMENGHLGYYLSDRQHDHAWTETGALEGYFSGLLLSKEIPGDKWSIEVKTLHAIPPGNGRWLSCFVWAGKSGIRPSWKNTGQAFGLGLFHMADQVDDPGINLDMEAVRGESVLADKRIKRNIPYFRFRRDGYDFYLDLSGDGKNYEEGMHLKAPAGIDGAVSKIVLGGQAYGDAAGTYVEYEYLKLNGKELF